MSMRVFLKTLVIFILGIVFLLLGVVVPGNPHAPSHFGGAPRLLYIGVSSAYLTGGGIAYLTQRKTLEPTFDKVFRASLFAIPIAAFLSFVVNFMFATLPAMPGLSWAVDRSIWIAFILHLGTGVLFYPIVYGLALGVASDARDHTTVRLIIAYSGGIILLIALIPLYFGRGGFVGAYAIIGIFIVVIVNIVLAVPLYRLGRNLNTRISPATNF